MYWYGERGNTLRITLSDARGCTHSGPCDDDIAHLARVRYIARQLDALTPESVRAELREMGAWDSAELTDHHQNLHRLLWIAAGDISEQNRGKY